MQTKVILAACCAVGLFVATNASAGSRAVLPQVTVVHGNRVSGNYGDSVAACPPGSVVSGGGWTGYIAAAYPAESSITSAKQGNGWEVNESSGARSQFAAEALCVS